MRRRGKTEIHERLSIEAGDVLSRWWELANADSNELAQHRRVACRHCHGVEGAYQWIDEAEFSDALATATMEAGGNPILCAMLPTEKGGYGYDSTADPSPACKRCRGEGVGVVWLADTRS